MNGLDWSACVLPTPSSASCTPGRRGPGAGVRALLQFTVGAALALADGSMITGVNVENGSFGSRSAPSGGDGARRVRGASLVPGHRRGGARSTTSPCGACRQVLREFGGTSMTVTFPHAGSLVTMTIDELLPAGFVLYGRRR